MLPYIKIFTDVRETVDLLSDTEAGRLLKSLLAYGNDEVVELVGQEKLVYMMIKRQIDRDRERYQSQAERNRENGAKGGRPKNPEKPSGFFENPQEPRKTQEKEKEKEKEKEEEEDKDKDKYIACEILSILNDRAGRHYRMTDSTRKHISARLREGYKLDDFRTVVEKKCSEWLGTDYEQYLRPETLFGTKFDGYLNQPVRKPQADKSWDFETLGNDENRVFVEPDEEGGFPF